MSDRVTILVDGRQITCPAGTMLAAALLNAGIWRFRDAVRGGARAPLCGMGTCHECRVTVDCIPHVRACLVTARDGQCVTTREAAP